MIHPRKQALRHRKCRSNPNISLEFIDTQVDNVLFSQAHALPRGILRARNDKQGPACASGKRLPFRELEALAGAFAAVFFAFFHAAVAGEIAGIVDLFDHAAGGLTIGAGGGLAEHNFQGTGDALADGASLAGEAAAMDQDRHVQARAHLGQDERADHSGAILFFGVIVIQGPAIDGDLAGALEQADAGHGSFAPTRGPIISLLGGFNHKRSPTNYPVSALRVFGLDAREWARHRCSAWSSAAGPGDCAAPCGGPPIPESAPDAWPSGSAPS